ncbi:hypothetical protein HPB51_014493 [Rhipicephalus microplus]|uniref:Uncharacterized protein n=1 Tax=Rhipicephalus microplus TaxID=6941 RepID=A0A9J6EGH9_RHIMP|nr:hypothetical protein HPB51_014493 [Rhipicephalus microplus]
MNKSEPANRRREERRVKARSTNPATPEQIGQNGRDRYGGRSAGRRTQWTGGASLFRTRSAPDFVVCSRDASQAAADYNMSLVEMTGRRGGFVRPHEGQWGWHHRTDHSHAYSTPCVWLRQVAPLAGDAVMVGERSGPDETNGESAAVCERSAGTEHFPLAARRFKYSPVGYCTLSSTLQSRPKPPLFESLRLP